MAYYVNREGKLTSTAGLAGDDQVSALDQMKAQDARSARAGAENIANTQAAAQIQSAQLQADAAVEAAKQRALRNIPDYGRGYKNGGPVIKGEFKHTNPTYAKFGQSGDSSLLAKGRK